MTQQPAHRQGKLKFDISLRVRLLIITTAFAFGGEYLANTNSGWQSKRLKNCVSGNAKIARELFFDRSNYKKGYFSKSNV